MIAKFSSTGCIKDSQRGNCKVQVMALVLKCLFSHDLGKLGLLLFSCKIKILVISKLFTYATHDMNMLVSVTV